MEIPPALEPAARFVRQVIDDDIPQLAAALAYRFLFALFPFAIFLAALAAFVAGWIGIDDPTSRILGAVADNLPPDVAGQIAPQLDAVIGQTRPGLLSVGAIVALWAATGGIKSLIKAMNRAYEVPESRSFVARTSLAGGLTVLGSAGILVAFVTIVGGSLLTEQAVASLGLGPSGWEAVSVLRWPVVLALVAVAVALLFRFGPNVAVSLRWTFAGGVAFAIGWAVATAIFSIYVSNFADYANTYGALGGVVVLMLWFYITALLLLLAAELTSFLAKAYEPERITAGRIAAGRTAATGQPVDVADHAPVVGPVSDAGGPGSGVTADGVQPGPPEPGTGRPPTRSPRSGDVESQRRRRLDRVIALMVLVAGLAGAVIGRAVGKRGVPARR
jgi:membrane protein